MEDSLERSELIKRCYWKFQKRPAEKSVAEDIRRTNEIPLPDLVAACDFVMDQEKFPFNLSGALRKIYFGKKPRSFEKKIRCHACNDNGLIIHELFDPYFRWASPCHCRAGNKFEEWMERDTDRATIRYLKKRGVTFKSERKTDVKNQDFTSF